jgi:hypothetical protein
MAMKTLESLVLNGIRVVAGVKTSLVREGSKRAHVQTPASLSHPRHLSPSWPLTDYQADSRRDLFDEDAPIQAGRSVSSASVPVSCLVAPDLSLAHGRTIRSRWSLAEGGPCSTAVRRFGSLATTRTSGANGPLGHPTFSRFAADGMKQMPLKQARGKTRLAWPMPMPAMPSASTRGA